MISPWIIVFLLFGLSSLTAALQEYDPTAFESNLYLAINPKPSWGNLMRKEKSIRILLIGGSNSNGCCCMHHKKMPFSKIVDSNISEYSGSYLLNRAISGSRPYMFIGQTYDFETWPIGRWPNIVLLEVSQNSNIGWQNTLEIDNMLYILLEKWALVGLPPPDVVFLELFSTQLYDKLDSITDNVENRIQSLNSMESYTANDKLSVNINPRQVYIDALARFYSYPVLSVQKTWLPAFTRFFVENSFSKRWPYLYDNVHATCLGHKYIANVILRFLREQMARSVVEESNTSYAIRMFPISSYAKVIKNWPIWGIRSNNHCHVSSFLEIVEPADGWGITYLDNGHHKFHDGHDCYGSHGENKLMATFNVQVPSKYQSCSIRISYLHSWNQSFVGDVFCNLYSADRQPISNVTIIGNMYSGVAMHATLPGEIAFPGSVAGGLYKVQCSKLDSKFACFTRLTIVSNF